MGRPRRGLLRREGSGGALDGAGGQMVAQGQDGTQGSSMTSVSREWLSRTPDYRRGGGNLAILPF